MLEQRVKKRNKITANCGVFAFFLLLFFCLYIFFRFVRPITPYGIDDWNTVMSFMAMKSGPYPEVGSGYFFPQIMGALSGFIAGFVIYPITGEYIFSYATVGAVFMSISILIVLFFIYFLLKKFTARKQYAVFGTFYFLLAAFLIFRTGTSSEYLFWQYNYCTIIFYGLPNYLASAVAIYLLFRYIYNLTFALDLKTGFVVLSLYCLNYSFLPAAFLLSVISFSIVISAYINCRNIKKTCQDCFIYLLNWPLFLIEFYCEFMRTFGTGYFHTPVNFSLQLKSSFDFFLYTFTRMNFLFVIITIVILLLSVIVYFNVKFNHALCKEDYIFAKISFVLLISIILMMVFFILFGAIDIYHITTGGGFIRIDTMYPLYFLIIVQTAFCLCYLLKKIESIRIALPVLFFVMFFIIVSPKYSYKIANCDIDPESNISSLYTKVMSEAVQEIQQREDAGITSLIVHVPEFWGYGGDLAYPLYRHHVTDHLCKIEFHCESDIVEPYFE